MAFTRKQIVTGFSVVYLLTLSALAVYALHSTHVYSLPIPDVVSALTITLPPLAGVALEAVLSLNEKLAAKGQLQTSRIFQVTIAFFLIYESVLATLAGTHISPPGSLTCALKERWQKMWSDHDADCIKRIQDTFQCCGLMSVNDMAWPFQDKTHGVDACVVRYERDQSCFEPWRMEERKVAVMLLVVPVAVFLWKVAIVLSPSSQSSWLPSQIRLPSDGSGSQSQDASPTHRRPLPAIGYRDLEDQAEADSLTREVTNLNKDSQLATHVERNTRKSHGLTNEAAIWRQQQGRGEEGQ